MMNKNEKEAVRMMAMEAFDILDNMYSPVTIDLKTGRLLEAIDKKTYDRIINMMWNIERAFVEDELKWFEIGTVPPFSNTKILKEFNK